LTAELQPDIILLDLEMPLMDGVEAIRRLRRRGTSDPYNAPSHTIHIIVFTAFDNDERIIDALQAGANGYLLKDAPREEIFNAIRVTMQGGSLLQPVVASKLLRHMEQHGIPPLRATTKGSHPGNGVPAYTSPQSIPPHRTTHAPMGTTRYRIPPMETLTERELEVLHLLAQGMPNKEIAAQLTISERTAKFHVSSIMGKLGATNRTEAVSLAAQRGLITLRS
jgi:DNA-binding NarL/FixJ family response regulator